MQGTLVSDRDASVCLELDSKGATVWQSNISLSSGIGSNFTISLDKTTIDSLAGPELVLKVRHNGREMFSESAMVEMDGSIAVPVTAEVYPNIIGDLDIPDFVDTHDTVDGIVRIGSLILCNRDGDNDIVISVILDGNSIHHARIRIETGIKEVGLSAPFTLIVHDETCARELTVRVTDTAGNVILHKIHTLRIRSKFDMDLNDITTRSVQFINPRKEEIMRLIHDSDGPLAHAMSEPYMISGYQNGGRDVIRQMEAAYMMLHRMGISYVSDTFTFNRSNENYQHVKTPDKVLEDRSGNCIELCILYASLMEAMGLEPVLAFPPGHALVGVVLSTDVYPSKSTYQEEEIPYVTMTIDDRTADVMFVETTACPWDDDFVDAVCLAYNKVSDNLDAICDKEGHVFVKMMRQIGVDPLLHM